MELARLNVAQACGLIGALMLAIGVFSPILNVPLMGPVNVFFNGAGWGVVLLLGSLLSFIAILSRKAMIVAIVGFFSFVTITVRLLEFRDRLEKAASDTRAELAGNPFSGLAAGALDAVQVQSGFGLMLIGSVLMIIGGLLSLQGEEAVYLPSSVKLDKRASVERAVVPKGPTVRKPKLTDDEHAHNQWVRQQFEIWLVRRSDLPPQTVAERSKLFEHFKIQLEKGEIDLIALRDNKDKVKVAE